MIFKNMKNMNDLKLKFLIIKQKWLAALPTIFVSIFLFLTTWYFFGVYNIIISPFLTLLFRFRHTEDFRLKSLLKTYFIMIVVAVSTFLATQTFGMCMVLNFSIPFILVYLLTNKFNPKAYFIYGMEFIFMQMRPVPFAQFIVQLEALIYGMVVVAVSLYGYSKMIKRKRRYGTVRKGMKTYSVIFEKLVKGEDFSGEIIDIKEMIFHMNQIIYTSRNYSSIATNYGKINYWFMMIFQRLQYFIEHFTDNGKHLTEKDKKYFLKLGEIFVEVETQLNQKDNQPIITHIEEFMSNNKLSSLKAQEALNEILYLIQISLAHLEKITSIHKQQKDWVLPKSSNQLKSINSIFKFDLFQIRFALRLAAVLCISFSFSFSTKLEHAYWYPMTSFFMLMPYAEESILKINNRILGTISGLFISYFLMSIFHDTSHRIIIIIFMTFFMYYVPVTSWTITMYSTCYSMALATLTLGLGDAIFLRILYVGLAALTTFFANHFILPNTAKREFKKSVNQLFDVDMKMVEATRKNCGENPDINILRDLVIHSHLLTVEIRNYMKQYLNAEEKEFYSQMLPINNRLITEMEQLNSFLYYRRDRFSLQDNIILQEVLNNVEDTVKRIRISYTENGLTSFMETNSELNLFGKMEERLYFNTLVFNCMDTAKMLLSLREKIPLK